MFDYDIKQIMIDEGFRSHPYRCTEGYLTIGFGLNLDAGISEDLARTILAEQLHAKVTELRQKMPNFDGYPDEVKNILSNMAFNLGVTGLLKFKKMIAALDLSMYDTAANEMLDSKWARQVPNRANRLADRMRVLA